MSSLTPGRTLTITYDVPEPALIEEAWAQGRRGADIAPGQQGSVSSGVYYWSSGCWTLFPVQKNLHLLREQTNALVIPQTKMTLITGLVATAVVALHATANQWTQQGNIPLTTYSGAVQPSGDPFIIKRVPAGITGYNPLPSNLDLPPADSENVVMDRTGESNNAYPADQGFCWRWMLPGGPHEHPDGVMTVYFGQFALYLDGTGKAHLWENSTLQIGPANWLLRDEWQYCLSSQVTNVEHCLLIFPHLDRDGGKCIDFSGNALDIAATLGGGASTNSHAVSASNHVYRAGPLAYAYLPDPCPGFATVSGPARYDTRRDLRLAVQVSTLGFSPAGSLQDYPMALPPQTSASAVVSGWLDARIPPTCQFAAQVNDTDNYEGGNSFGAFVPGTNTKPFVQFSFGGDGNSTPLLWGYTLSRPPVIEENAPGAFTGGTNRSLTLSGQSADAQQETGTLVVSDVTAQLPRFQNRGLIGTRILSSFLDPSGTLREAMIFRGYVRQPTAKKKGKLYRTYPSPDWREYSAPLIGMWQRLARRVQDSSFRLFTLDPNAPSDPITGAPPPYKVTDAIREMIYACGFDPSYVNIPDLPFRLWPSHDGQNDANTVSPKTTLASHIQTMCRQYLGGYLTYDLSAGSDGQWTILFAPQQDAGGNYAPVFNFVTAPNGYGESVQPAPHLPEYYPPDADGVPSAPIVGSYTWQNIPPEYNLVLVVAGVAIDSNGVQGRICNWAYNPLSYNVPGFTQQADPMHQDYLPGGCSACIVVDASLGGAGATPAAVQRSVDWTVRRVFDTVAHGQKIARIRAPFSFVLDPNTGNWRPLRALDAVSINGVPKFIIKGVEFNSQRGAVQYATYEVIAPGYSQYIRGGSGLDFYRRAADAHSRQTTGHATQSHEHALKSVTASAEQQILALPDFGFFRQPLQASTGQFFFNPDYDGVGSPTVLR